MNNFYKSELDLTGAMELDRVQIFRDSDPNNSSMHIEFERILRTKSDTPIFIKSVIQVSEDNYYALKLAIALIDKALERGDEAISCDDNPTEIYVMAGDDGDTVKLEDYLNSQLLNLIPSHQARYRVRYLSTQL